ncbi:hypothetical protein Purlil1_13022 [Purpureocillium lilacinum]|uniref:Uncharacterized protein n=1 Tax=Purpureocillium lilacinum TaxID=33203 RepID=A0ABR0BFG2_PURLI|nr:hypothetical protein Purlil1_13022 [Purpureocillium lilacinum]
MIAFTADDISSLVTWPKGNLTEIPWLPPVTAGGHSVRCGTRETTYYRGPGYGGQDSIQDHIVTFAEDPYSGPQKTFGWEPHVAADPNGGIVLRFSSKGKAIDGHEIDGVCFGLGEYDPFP